MKKKRILFLIESLSGGGAEKVLTVLLKHLDYERYEVTVCPILDTGIYCEEVKKYVTHYQTVITYRGNLFSRFLNRVKYKLIYSVLPLFIVYKWFIPKGNDVEIAFCEGYVTKLLSHVKSKSRKIAWIHTDLKNNPWPLEFGVYKDLDEEKHCYLKMDHIVCVSQTVEVSFREKYGLIDRISTIYNPIDGDEIRQKAGVRTQHEDGVFRLISVGRLVPQKGYDRLLHVVKKLHDEGFPIRLLILGDGQERAVLENYILENQMQSFVCLPGFDKNPYSHLVNSDLFVCSSRTEGFSTVVSEALVLGLPVVTTDCSGMNELLEKGKLGVITENNEESLYEGVKSILSDSSLFSEIKAKVAQKSNNFELKASIEKIENILS